MRDIYLKLVGKKKLITILFYFLLLTFPFGSFLLPISIGFATIYPNLITLLILFTLGIFNYKVITTKLEWFTIYFFIFWFLYSLTGFFFVEGKTSAYYEVRSVLLMGVTIYVIVWIKNFLGLEDFIKKVYKIFEIIYFFLVSISIFEIYTGIHFKGEFTNKIITLPIGNVTYSPAFLSDNQNTFLAVLLTIGAILLLFRSKFQRNIFISIAVIITSFFVSYVSASRMGEYVSYFMTVWLLTNYLRDIYNHYRQKKSLKEQHIFTFFLLIVLIIVGISKPIYVGPKLRKETFVYKQKLTVAKELKGVNEKSRLIEMQYVQYLNQDVLDSNYNSVKIREALIYNGIDYLTKSNYLGIGPGQYRHKHINNDKKYYTKTNIGPHFWLIEVLSQYGIIVFLGYVSVLLWVTVICLKNIIKSFYISLLVIMCIGVFLGASILPSSFIVIDAGWYFFAFLISLVSDKAFFDKTKLEA